MLLRPAPCGRHLRTSPPHHVPRLQDQTLDRPADATPGLSFQRARSLTNRCHRYGRERSAGAIARVLNHIDGSPRATKAYDRHTYDAEKLQTWERRLDHILTGTKSAVVPFRPANP